MKPPRQAIRRLVFAGLESPGAHDGYGTPVSYVTLTRGLLIARRPARQADVINACRPGKTTGPELRIYWEDDVLAHRPDTLCLAMGIDDARQWLRGPAPGAAAPATPAEVSPAGFRAHFRWALTRARACGCRQFILLEPFFIARPRATLWADRVLAALPRYQAVVRAVAREFHATHIPVHRLFQQHLRRREPADLCGYPDIPNATGHMIIAHALYRALEKSG